MNIDKIDETWNGHSPEIISMRDDEGEFCVSGKSVLLRRGNYGLLCNWVTTDPESGRGSFDVLPVEILEDGSLRPASKSSIDFVGGIDIWSQGYGLFSWRESFKHAVSHIPEKEEISRFEDVRDARRPKLAVFIPPEELNTNE